MTDRSLFTDYIKALGVPHTASYSRRRFTSYPHKLAMMAVGDLLADYGVVTHELKADASPDVAALCYPAVVALADGSYAIALGRAGGSVSLRLRTGKVEAVPDADFVKQWTGRAVWGVPDAQSAEPHLARHRFVEVMGVAQKALLLAGLVFIAAYFFVTRHIYATWGGVALAVLYMAGIYVTSLLVLKDNGVHSGTAEKMCGVMKNGGCSTVLDDSSSKLFGLYPWCEIGLTYFSVSLATLLIAPEYTPWLAAFAVCCLPYTVWSVTYQKFKIHAWCTLCLTVQALMWLIFAVMLFGGFFGPLLPVPTGAVVLVMCYVTGFLIVHRLVEAIFSYESTSRI